MTDKPTRDDVAKKGNVSPATVSRVLGGRTDIPVSPETRARVLSAAQALGYRPNSAAVALGKKRTGVVALWMDLGYSRYHAHFLDHARSVLTTAEVSLTAWDMGGHEEDAVERALRVWVDGIITLDSPYAVQAMERRRNPLGSNVPFVSIGDFCPPALSYVAVDVRVGAAAAVRHLIDTGRRRIVLLAPSKNGKRFEAFQEELRLAELPTQTILTKSSQLADVDEAITGHSPDAVLCVNDDIAVSAATSLTKRGMALGRDVALIGFDDVRETAEGACPISTVAQPVSQMCALALESLQEQMRNPMEPPRQIVLSPELIIRESSLPGSSPDRQP